MSEPTIAGQPRELMASSIVTISVRVSIAEAGDVHPGDDVQLTPITGPIHVLDVQDGLGTRPDRPRRPVIPGRPVGCLSRTSAERSWCRPTSR